jgi:hypothetical protein
MIAAIGPCFSIAFILLPGFSPKTAYASYILTAKRPCLTNYFVDNQAGSDNGLARCELVAYLVVSCYNRAGGMYKT